MIEPELRARRVGNVLLVALGFGAVIMIHEFGHLIGLDHSQINLEILGGSYPCNQDDVAGLPIMFHSCGDITRYLPHLIGIGLSVRQQRRSRLLHGEIGDIGVLLRQAGGRRHGLRQAYALLQCERLGLSLCE